MNSNDYVKIYNGGETLSSVSVEDEHALRYLEHKKLGNTVKTKELGLLLSNCLIDAKKCFINDEHLKQKLTLIAFVMCDTLEQLITDEILQKSALAAFKQALLEADTELYEAITDSAAFTLYIVEDRKKTSESGKIYAELCGHGNTPELIECGNRMDSEFRDTFTKIISGYSFDS